MQTLSNRNRDGNYKKLKSQINCRNSYYAEIVYLKGYVTIHPTLYVTERFRGRLKLINQVMDHGPHGYHIKGKAQMLYCQREVSLTVSEFCFYDDAKKHNNNRTSPSLVLTMRGWCWEENWKIKI